MRVLIFLFLTIRILYASEIDTKLFEGPQQESYYQEIQKQIEASLKNGQRPKEILQEEKLYLQRVRSASSQVVQIDKYDLKSFANDTINLADYYSAVSAAAQLHLKLKQHNEILHDIQSKLLFSKEAIEGITEEEKPRLLSYQLQYAYYKLQKKNIETRSTLLQKHEEEIMKLLLKSLPLLQCDLSHAIEKKLQKSDKDIQQAFQQKISLEIDLEKALIEESQKAESVQQKIKEKETQYQSALKTKIMLQVQKSLCMIKNRQNKDLFKLLGEIERLTKDLSREEERLLYTYELAILSEISKEVLGSTKLFFGTTLHESTQIWAELKAYFTSTLFVFNEQPITLASLLKVLALIIFGLFIGMLYKRWIAGMARRWPNMSQMSVRLASNIGYYVIVILSFMIAISSIGIDMSSISLIAGALSIGIGFGLQTVVSNLIAGIILMFERTIRIGDTIEISDVLRGRVTDMRIRSTTVKTFDNVDIVVPNSSFIQHNVINWTLEDLSRRLHIPFGVAYGTEVNDVSQAVLTELEQSNLNYIKDDEAKKPEIWMIAMNNSSLDFELLVWIEWDNRLRPNSFKSDFLILIYNALNKHGIQIPYPQLDLHVKQMPSSV